MNDESNQMGPTQAAVHEILRQLIQQNNTWDQQVMNILENIASQRVQPVSASGTILNLNATIGTFDGESDDAGHAQGWISSLETTALLNQWPDLYKLEAARSHLTGAARSWYLARQSEIETWAKFKEQFEQMFTTAISVSEQWKRLQARTQQRNETVYAYFHDKMRMCRQLKLSKSESKKLMCMGLHSKDMCNVLMSRTHNEEYEVLQDLREFDEVIQGRNERFKPTTNSKSTLSKEINFKNITKPMISPSSQTQPIKPVMPAAFKRENPEVKCYNCQLLGHIARDCPQPRRPLKCSKCKAEGHTAKYCTTRSLDIALVEQNQTDNRTVYIKDVYLNNSTEAIKGLVDTGSTLTIIRRSLAERYGMDITPRKIQLRVYGNVPCVIGSGDTEAEVRIDTVSEKIKLLVVEDHIQNFDIIIGRTFINCANVSFIKTADQLIFAYDMPLPFTNEPDEALCEQRPVTSVTVHGLHEIPAASVKMVEVDVNSTIVEVLMVNHGDEPVQLKRGTQVKRLHMAMQQSGPSQPYEEPITKAKVKYNPQFAEHEVTQLINLLTEYRKCFAFNMFEVGCTKAITMDIVDNNVPVNSKPYRASAQERDTIDRIVREWKAAGIVRESESPYASPVLLVTKKSGEPRLVVDYRKLNSQTVRKVYPTPNMDDHLEVLTGAKMFCTLDLASGYLQVPLTEEAKAKTSFITPTEKGEFERMVFGLINAPYEFSRLMKKVMQHLERDVAMWYLDDILIPARSFEEMMIRLRKVLDALSSASLTLKLEKCYFGYEEVTYLGFRLSAYGIKPGEDKAAAILKIEHPTNRHEVRRFLGLTGFFRRFVPQYAQIAKPLTELTKNAVPYEWGYSQQEAFDTLKVKLTSNPVLQLFNPNAYTELHCDASQQGLSGLLLQRRNEDKLLHLVYAVSKKTTTAERNYHAGKLELMAIVWSVTRLRHLLIGMQFIIVTDCQAIVHLNTKKTVNPQVARWANLLSEYNYEIRHRPGVKMAHADALSRAPVNTSTDTEEEFEELEIMITMTAEEHIITMQRSDENICSMIKIMTKPTEERSLNEQREVMDYVMRQGIVYKRVRIQGEERQLWVVPNAMRKSIVVQNHDMAGHFALDRTVAKIMERYYFARMRSYVRVHIRCCPECILTKIPRGRPQGELHPIPPGRRPFEVIHLDHIGPFVRSTAGKNYILVLVDNLTKYVKLYPVRACNAEAVIKSLQQFILTYGVPKKAISDRGTAFTARQFGEFCMSRGINHILTSVRHPQSNGQVERVNSTLVPVLQANMQNDNTWDKNILEVESQLNNVQNKTTGETPFRLLHGYYPSFHDGILRHIVTEEQPTDVTKLQEKARETIEKEQRVWKTRYDAKHITPAQYKVGEVIFLRTPPKHTGEPTKLQPKYRGPYVVSKVLPNDTYQITDVIVKDGRQYRATVHATHMKGYKLGPESDDMGEEIDNTSQKGEEETETEDQKQQETDEVKQESPTRTRVRKPPRWMEDYV